MRRKHTSAARDLADMLQHASPETAAANAHQVEALRRKVAAEMAAAYRLTPAKPAAPSEHDEQCVLFAWAAAMEGAHPELAMLFAVPNGGARHPAVAAQLKASGTKAGVPDVLLLCRRGGFGGMAIELKKADRSNKPTLLQMAWIERLRAYGYMAVICYGADEAIAAILAYLGQED